MSIAGTAFSLLLLAQVNIGGVPESYLGSLYRSVGLVETLLIVSAGLALLVGACWVVFKNRRPSVIAAYLVFLPLPLILGSYGPLEKQIHSLIVLSRSPTVQPFASQIAAGIASAFSTVAYGNYSNVSIICGSGDRSVSSRREG